MKSIDVPALVLIIGAVFSAVTVVVAGIMVGRQRAQQSAVAELQASLRTFIATNDELRKVNEDQRSEHARERKKWQDELAAEREKRAKLEGRLDAVTSHLAAQIVAAVAAAVAPITGPTTTTTTTTTPGVLS